MSIQEQFAIEQAIANVKLENLRPSDKVVALMRQGKLDTSEILKIVLNG